MCGCECHTTIDHVISHPSDILKSDKSPYTVFTPYSREWKKHFMERVATFSLENQRLLIPHDLVKAQGSSRFPSLKDLGFVPSQVTFPSSLPTIDIIKNYDKTRDFPSQNGTSKLGVHLRFGTISIRSLAEIAWNTNTTFLNELIWREFYIMILYHFPFVQDSSFKTDYRGISWLNQADDIEKWKSGKTGYPLVDAGMRELVNTGYMHNRVRMVTASFLTKHLLVDWRIGEAFFAKHLLDFELASNNGGWQWCAGTGTDAAPYFRIFNPTIQAKTFDPESKYIRKWVPEIDTFEYPKPIVEHTFARQRCLDVYKIGIQPKIKING
ncbi:MAG: deoxyribodipyrimidine photo-lyase [Saprospiraceae bacterium]